MIERIIESAILNDFTRKKVIVLLGARQVGKTTLLESLRKKGQKVFSVNCDDMDDVLLIEEKTSTELRALLTPYDLVFIDEAQRVKNIGLTLKKIGDLKLDTQVVVTGSSSLELADEVNEPATGRLIEYRLFPFSLSELATHTSEREEQRMLEQRLIYGLVLESLPSRDTSGGAPHQQRSLKIHRKPVHVVRYIYNHILLALEDLSFKQLGGKLYCPDLSQTLDLDGLTSI